MILAFLVCLQKGEWRNSFMLSLSSKIRALASPSSAMFASLPALYNTGVYNKSSHHRGARLVVRANSMVHACKCLPHIFNWLLAWLAVNLITRPPPHLRGLVIGCCAAGNLGNILIIIVPTVCKEKGSPFGDPSVCSTYGLAYSSISMTTHSEALFGENSGRVHYLGFSVIAS